MSTHPNCRCIPLPDVDGVDVPLGIERFEQLSEARKREILGPAKYEAYRRGFITLEDVRGFKNIGRPGGGGFIRVGYERSLTSIVGPEWATIFKAAARQAA